MLFGPYSTAPKLRPPALWTFFGRLVHGDLVRQIEYLKVEHAILRAHIPRQRVRVTPQERTRLLQFGQAVGEDLRHLIKVVPYKTFQRWVREQSDQPAKPHGKRGRPRTPEEIRDLLLRMARENLWGYSRLLSELRKLGITAICRTTIRNILDEAGLPSNPERGRDGWDHFVRRHLDTLVACDFFTKEVWTPFGKRFAYALVFLHVGTRKVYVSPPTFHPNTRWVTQQARNVLLYLGDNGLGASILIHDRDTKYCRAFRETFRSEGIRVKPLPVRSPNLNGHCEAWIGSLKRECLNHFLCFGLTHLDYLLREYADYYNTVRPHSAMGHRPLAPHTPVREGPVRCRTRLGGLLNHDYREAA